MGEAVRMLMNINGILPTKPDTMPVKTGVVEVIVKNYVDFLRLISKSIELKKPLDGPDLKNRLPKNIFIMVLFQTLWKQSKITPTTTPTNKSKPSPRPIALERF